MLGRYISVAILSRAADAGAEPAVLICASAAGLSTGHGALVLGALTASAALGGPLLGAAVDRARHVASAYAAGLLAIGAGLAALAVGLGRFPLIALLAIGVLAGVAQPLFSGGWTAVLGAIVPAERIHRAYAIDAVTYDLGGILGPALAAAAVGVGDRAPLLTMAALALLALPAVATTRWPRTPRAGGDFRGEVRAGLRSLARIPALRSVTILSTLQYAGMAARTVTVPALAHQLTGSTAFAGVLFAVSAAASLTGSALLTRFTLPWPPHRVAIAGTVVSAASLAGLAATGSAWTAGLLFAAGGLLDAPLLTSVFTVRGEQTPPQLRAQVFATAASIKTSSYAIAILAFGLVAGMRSGLIAGAAVQLLGILLAAPRTRSRESLAA
ncbi:MAG TPA: MFS transporter [Mycobacteriales bacterium]|nr:MFS transporter [Mycobacteriales bacterium]